MCVYYEFLLSAIIEQMAVHAEVKILQEFKTAWTLLFMQTWWKKFYVILKVERDSKEIYTTNKLIIHKVGSKIYAYDALWKTVVVRRWCGRWLIRTTSVSQNSQLLGTRIPTFSERTKLNPISADRLVGIYDEIVTFTYWSNVKLQMTFFFVASMNNNCTWWSMLCE